MIVRVQDYGHWRTTARELLQKNVSPEAVIWMCADDGQDFLFDPGGAAAQTPASEIRVPRAFFPLAETVARHRDPQRWSMLYRLAWRLRNGEPDLLAIETDDLVAAVGSLRRAVEKDIYRMRQFVRFRRIVDGGNERFVAWYEPEHDTLDANGRFFRDRFGSMRWAILTPSASLVWDLEQLEIGPGVPRSDAPSDDEMENLWRVYYRTIYNPARMKLTAMRAQLPVSRWKNLPESQTIPDLVRISRGRVQDMADAQPRSAADWIPPQADLSQLRKAVQQCHACELCSRATQPVWGEGPIQSKLVLIGEQPGDEEDLAGRPFVGPAGQVLNAAMREAGLDRTQLYVTNAVKAFKFEERGKRRIHQTPRSSEIAACRPWLLAELQAVQPRFVVCLGASAAQAVLGRKISIASERGQLLQFSGRQALVTYHPSAILRVPDEVSKQQLTASLVADLTRARELLLPGSS